jgi:hypothetical protein
MMNDALRLVHGGRPSGEIEPVLILVAQQKVSVVYQTQSYIGKFKRSSL